MNLKVQTLIHAPKEKIWRIITDIDKAVNHISAITEIQILERSSSKNSIIGLKWKETRKLFGKEATEIMWITDAVENHYYTTRAESHGNIYTSKLALTEKGNDTLLSMELNAQAEKFIVKIISSVMGFLFKGATKKALEQDLKDIKMLSENSS